MGTDDWLTAFAALIEPLHDARDIGLLIVDSEMRFVGVSEVIARLNRTPAAEHVGRPFRAVLPPPIAELVEGPLRRALESGKAVFDVEIDAVVDGQPRLWSDQFLPLKRDGIVVAVAILVVERTAHRMATQALRKSEELFRAICETAPIGVFFSDATGASVYANQVSLDQMGLTSEEARGTGWQRSIHPEDLARVRESYYAATLARQSYQGVNRYLHADGRVVYVDVKAKGIYDGETLLGYVGVAEDITEHRAADAALRESEMRFRQLAENVDACFWLASADHDEVLYVSPAYERIWGRPPSTVVRFGDFLKTIWPEDQPGVLAATQRGEHFTTEYRIVRPDGEIRWINDRAFPVRDENGVVIRQAGIATDITERKILEAQVLQSQKLDSIGRMAGGIAHDFNNLLGVIQGQVASVARDLESNSVDRSVLRERLREVEMAASHAKDLTRHLLTFARRQPIKAAVLDLNDVVAGVESILRRMLGNDVRLVLDLAPDLAIVRADPTQVEQVMMNLVSNARTAMPRGGTLSIGTRNLEHSETSAAALGIPSGHYVELSVSDTGVGIPEDTLPHIFEPFFTTHGSSGGTGLGLSTCYGIVKKSGGAISVDSRPFKGTTFRVHLPRIELSAPSA
jgi:PAS domain S-box-containing protein